MSFETFADNAIQAVFVLATSERVARLRHLLLKELEFEIEYTANPLLYE